jgi:ubiquinone/menaquinone biosynthesis C-methylase UbiE
MHPLVFRALLRGRSVALRLAQPLDTLHQRLTGATDLPPLWLRRHVGPIAGYERARGEIVAYLACRAPIAPGDTVLDIGCGTGVLIPDVLRALGPEGRYVGFDVHPPSIRWARRRYGSDPRVRLVVAEVYTPYYSPHNKLKATEYRFPVPDVSVHRVIAKSVFTHLLEPEAAHYLGEIARVLAPDGLAVVSAFLLGIAERPRLTTPALAFDHAVGRARVARMESPTSVVAYPWIVLTELLEHAGLRVVSRDLGWWSGGASAANYQDLLVLGRMPEM